VAIPRSEPVYRITGAPTAQSEDLRGRTRRYLFSMGLRTVCFVGATLVSGPLRWLLIAGALLLPYLAVVFANVGRRPQQEAPPTTTHHRTVNALGHHVDGRPDGSGVPDGSGGSGGSGKG
jgi:hypothetical protein